MHLSPDLTTDGFYSDSKSSVIDPAKWKAYYESSGPYKNLGQVIVDAADAWRSTGSRAAAACALSHMETAARDGVFTGKMSSHQAYYVQGWVIGAIAIGWLKVRDSGLETPQLHDLVVPWIVSVTRQTVDFYDSSHARNNHLYWAGVEAVAAAVAANDQQLFDWAVAGYRAGIAQIQPDGSMPLEMARGQRALHYHLFALSPLVYLAEFGQVNGLHLYAERDNALARLERLCVDGLNDNQFFVKATGIAQDTPTQGAPAAEQISWGVIWQSRFPDPAARVHPRPGRLPQLHVPRRPAARRQSQPRSTERKAIANDTEGPQSHLREPLPAIPTACNVSTALSPSSNTSAKATSRSASPTSAAA